MKKSTRFLAAALAALTLAAPLTSCANDTAPLDTQAPEQTAAVSEEETVLRDKLPDGLNFGGDEITFISRYLDGWTSGEIAVSDLISEPVNDAVYERNKAVEQRLGVKIVSIEEDNAAEHFVVNEVATAVKAGTHEYDVLAAACYAVLPETLSGTFVNLRSTEYLDFDQVWWSDGYNQVMEYADHQYTITGDALITLYRMAFVTVFNHQLFTDARQPFLYDYVEDGSWTLDKQISLVPLFHRDNGNGIQDDQGDVYGFASGTVASIDPYWSSCQVDIITKNTDGDYELVLDMDRIHGMAGKVLDLFHNTDGASRIFATHGYGGEHDDIRELFAAGFCAMATLRIMELERSSMRNMTDRYGVVPMPKYDENQTDYKTLLHDQFTVFTIPTTTTGDRLDEISAVLEAMASASYRIVKPAYYETTLRTKIAQDPQSAEMMDLIVRNVYIDAGIIYTSSLPGFQGSFRALVNSKQNDAVSRFTALNKQARNKLKGIIRKLDNLAIQ